jgi:hypothetical protein
MILNKSADWYTADAERKQNDAEDRRRHNKIIEEIRRANQTEAS